MEKIDDGLDAEWLSPDDLVEIHEEAPRISHVRELRAPREIEPVASARSDELGLPRAAQIGSRGSAAHTVAALARLLFFFVLGVGLGSVFALGVATALEIRRDAPRAAPSTVETRPGALDTTGAEPPFGEPGAAL